MEDLFSSRRSFIRKAAIGSLAAVSIPEILSASAKENSGKKIKPGERPDYTFSG